MEVAAGLHRIDTPLGPRTSSVYLVVGDRAALLFDTGVDGAIPSHVLPYLKTIGLPAERVRYVVASHADVDHYGGLADAREAFPAAVLGAHRDDAPLMADFDTFEGQRGRGFRDTYGLDETPEVQAWLREVCREAPLDLILTGGELIDLGGRVVEIMHVPGHSRGHLALHDPAADAAIVSDAVLSDAVRNADGSEAFPPTYRFVESYRASIDRIDALGVKLLLTAHYPTMRGDEGRAFLAASRAFTDRLERAILDTLAAFDTPPTLEEVCRVLNPRVGRWPEDGTLVALAFPVVGHLERLAAVGSLTLHRAADGVTRIGLTR